VAGVWGCRRPLPGAFSGPRVAGERLGPCLWAAGAPFPASVHPSPSFVAGKLFFFLKTNPVSLLAGSAAPESVPGAERAVAGPLAPALCGGCRKGEVGEQLGDAEPPRVSLPARCLAGTTARSRRSCALGCGLALSSCGSPAGLW